MLTAILELGAWLGTLINGYLADATGRRITVVIAVVVFCVGVIVQACTKNPDYVYAGRFVTGLGVGNLSMIVPLYNAELVCPNDTDKIPILTWIGTAGNPWLAGRCAAVIHYFWHHGQLLGKYMISWRMMKC
jgi:MFS family permease